MAASAIPLTHIGWKAQAALASTGGLAHVLASLSTSIYLTAGDEVIWLGRVGGIAHPRAMLTADRVRWGAPNWPPKPPDARSGEALVFDWAGGRPWSPRLRPPLTDVSLLSASARALLALLRQRSDGTPEPLGLGALLVGRVPTFPLDHAASRVADLARACDADNVDAAVAAADRLLGLGPGLTPSGDDLVGGLLFARNLIGGAARAAWREAACELVARARQRTNPISLALLSDLAAGHGHEPLHALSDALGRGAVGGQAVDAVRRLGTIGHSSGWDMLAGFLVGLVGPAALSRPYEVK